jgi:predicted ATPase
MRGRAVSDQGGAGASVQNKSKASHGQVENTSEDARPQTAAAAEAYFLNSIDIARRQSAKSLELWATMSLTRLWQQQGKKKQAHKLLSGIYGWFAEGFDTEDLQEAKALLEELS